MTSSDRYKIEKAEIIKHWENHPYYAQAEEWTHEFWGAGTRFAKYFEQLDTQNILELACGHGRHTAKILSKAGIVTLSDVNITNIDACKNRFESHRNVRYHVGSGSDFSGVATSSLSAIFCYDAMVHFELEDICSYIKDTTRALRQGGRALFHYSNYSANPGGHYRDNPHSRSFCSEEIFLHYCARAGLKVIGSETFGWGAPGHYVPSIDALTLLEKP